MRRHIMYFWYILQHKWYVFQAGLVVGAPIWRLIIHDWSKFLPSEWKPYAYTFRNADGSLRDYKRYGRHEGFTRAVGLHKKRNKHHYDYWVCFHGKKHTLYALEMPDKYILEMVADWMGAGKAITGSWDDIFGWYEDNKEDMVLGKETRRKVELLIQQLKKENSL